MVLPNRGAHTDGGTVTEGQDDKEVTSNLLDALLDNSQNKTSVLAVGAGGTFNLDTPQANLDLYLENGLIRLTGSPGAATTIIVPDGNIRVAFENASTQATTIDTVTGATPPVDIASGATKTIHVRGIEITIVADDALETGALKADGSVPATGNFDWVDKKITQAELKDYGETFTSPSSVAGTLTLDLENGNVFDVTLTEDTTYVFSNPPASGSAGSFSLRVVQDGTGGWTSTFPAEVAWAGGIVPSLSVGANDVDWLSFITLDGGSTWDGFLGGLDFT
jgi:hypothetical protein